MTFHRIENPLRFAGGYDLHLYCDHASDEHDLLEFPHEFYAETGAECRREAREKGWKINQDGTATCPKCVQRHRITSLAKRHRIVIKLNRQIGPHPVGSIHGVTSIVSHGGHTDYHCQYVIGEDTFVPASAADIVAEN